LQIRNSTGASPERDTAPRFSFMSYWMPFLSSRRLAAVGRVALVIMLTAGMTVGSWIAGVSASNESLPGEVLYKVKIAKESTQLALTSAFSSDANEPQATAKLQLEFASRRSEEVKGLVEKGPKEAAEHVPETMNKMKESIKEASNTLQEVKNDDAHIALTLAKDVTQKTTDIVENLKEVSSKTISSGDLSLTKEVVETSKIINNQGLEAIEVALENKGSTALAQQEEIKVLVGEKIDILVKNVQDTKAVVEEVKQLSTIVSTTLKIDIKETNLSPLAASSSSAPKIMTATSSLEIVPAKEVQKAGENIAEATKVANEAKELLADDHVKEAIQKVKTLNDITSQTQQDIVGAKTKVNAVLPLLTPTTTTVGVEVLTPKVQK
jgi:hypothetical protein